MKDVIIKPDAPNTLLLDKHADYIAAYGSKKDDYVSKDSHMFFFHPGHICPLLLLFELWETLNVTISYDI